MYELPEGWKWVRLEDLLLKSEGIQRGPWGSQIKKEIFVNRGYPVYEQGNVINGEFKNFRYFLTEKKFKEFSKYVVKPGDFLLTSAGTMGVIKEVPEYAPIGIINQALIRIRIDENKINKRYFMFAFGHIIDRVKNKYSKGCTIKNLVSVKILKNLLIPIPFKDGKPDLEKQKQIVEKIEKIFNEIDKAIELRQKAINETKELFNSVLNKIFKEAEEGEGWKWVILGDVFTDTIGGDWGKDLNDEKFNEKMYIIRGTDFKKIEENKIDDLPIRYIKSSKAKKILLEKDDLIIEISGGSKNQPTGRICLIPNVPKNQKIGFSNFVRKLVFNKNLYYPKYLYYQWQFLYLSGITSKYEKASTNIRNFKYKMFLSNEKIPIPYKDNKPDLEKQKQIANYLDNLSEKIKQLEQLQEKQLNLFKELKESILNKVFRGELV
ncbi:restriction endonuclease subunit S [Methanocaldococcus sp. 16A]